MGTTNNKKQKIKMNSSIRRNPNNNKKNKNKKKLTKTKTLPKNPKTITRNVLLIFICKCFKQTIQMKKIIQMLLYVF